MNRDDSDYGMHTTYGLGNGEVLLTPLRSWGWSWPTYLAIQSVERTYSPHPLIKVVLDSEAFLSPNK